METPTALKAATTSPEQSYEPGPLPPNTYGLPSCARRNAITRAALVELTTEALGEGLLVTGGGVALAGAGAADALIGAALPDGDAFTNTDVFGGRSFRMRGIDPVVG